MVIVAYCTGLKGEYTTESLQCRTQKKGGKTFYVKHGFDKKIAKYWWDNNYYNAPGQVICRTVLIECKGMTPKGYPRRPRLIRIMDDVDAMHYGVQQYLGRGTKLVYSEL